MNKASYKSWKKRVGRFEGQQYNDGSLTKAQWAARGFEHEKSIFEECCRLRDDLNYGCGQWCLQEFEHTIEMWRTYNIDSDIWRNFNEADNRTQSAESLIDLHTKFIKKILGSIELLGRIEEGVCYISDADGVELYKIDGETLICLNTNTVNISYMEMLKDVSLSMKIIREAQELESEEEEE